VDKNIEDILGQICYSKPVLKLRWPVEAEKNWKNSSEVTDWHLRFTFGSALGRSVFSTATQCEQTFDSTC
jgi:hypothetical protein